MAAHPQATCLVCPGDWAQACGDARAGGGQTCVG